MGAFDDFNLLIIEVAQKTLEPMILPILDKKRNLELENVVHNQMYGIDGPTSLSRNPSNEEKYVGKIWSGFIEIYESFERLQDTEIYLRRFPLSKTSVTKEKYLRFHIEAYLHEIYIFKERLKSYLTVIQRQYKNTEYEEAIKETLEIAKRKITDGMSNIIKIRDKHVHQFRFTDKRLERLSLLEFSYKNLGEDYKYLYDLSYRETKKYWLGVIRRNKEHIAILLDRYFYIIKPVIFDKKGKLRYPL